MERIGLKPHATEISAAKADFLKRFAYCPVSKLIQRWILRPTDGKNPVPTSPFFL
jgi:hypothetical protein